MSARLFSYKKERKSGCSTYVRNGAPSGTRSDSVVQKLAKMWVLGAFLVQKTLFFAILINFIYTILGNKTGNKISNSACFLPLTDSRRINPYMHRRVYRAYVPRTFSTLLLKLRIRYSEYKKSFSNRIICVQVKPN